MDALTVTVTWDGRERRRKPRKFTPNLELNLGCECLDDGKLVPYCQKMRGMYNGRCPIICQFLRTSYRRIWQDNRPETSQRIEEIDETLIFLKNEADIMLNLKTQAQFIMMTRQEMTHQTRLFLRKRRLKNDDLGIQFTIVRGLNKPFQEKWWTKMLDEIDDDHNRGYAGETFLERDEERNLNIIELFWQYRHGGGIEYFKKHHLELFD